MPPVPARETAPPWQSLLAAAVSDPAVLLARLGLPASLLPAARAAAALFPLRVPEGYIARIRPRDLDDPLLRQILPLGAELDTRAGYTEDPLEEVGALVVPGLLYKYRGRALLITTAACAVHCRYCFRRHYPYAGAHASGSRLEPALAAVAADPSIREVILSGGDPLSLSDTRLAALQARLAAIAHVTTLRIHTRLPVVLPERVDGPLLRWLGRSRLRTVVVVHANHPQEMDPPVALALRRLATAPVTLLNQSVLLRGVNDNREALRGLSEALFAARTLPYYLHLPDRVAGTAHFAVGLRRARALIAALRAELPGYLVPRLVREVPGLPGKRVLA